MNNLEKKALDIISRGGNLGKEMKVTSSKLKEVTDGLVRGDFAKHERGKYLLTRKGKMKIKE